MEWLKVAWEVFLSFVEDWGDTTLAFLSFGLSVFALIKSSKADKLKNKVNALELKIKEYELEQIEKEKDRESLSCVEARAYDAGNDNYRLRVWNSGNTTAYNTLCFVCGNCVCHHNGDLLKSDPILQHEFLCCDGCCGPIIKFDSHTFVIGFNNFTHAAVFILIGIAYCHYTHTNCQLQPFGAR